MAVMKAYEEVIDFIARGSSSREVSEFTPSPEVKARAWELLAREKAGEITQEERAELDSYTQLEHIMRLAKARATQHLSLE